MPAEEPRDREAKRAADREAGREAALAEALKGAMRLFPSGVTVVTSGQGERAEGMTANAVISVSLRPPLFLVSVHEEARLAPLIRAEGYYAVNVLADDQEGLSRLFASPERSGGLAAVKALGGGYGAATGAPLAAGALATIECKLEAVYPGGDHGLFLGRVVAVGTGDAPGETGKGPLVYHEGGYPLLNPVPRPEASGAFVDSVRGFDARVQGLRERRKRRRNP